MLSLHLLQRPFQRANLQRHSSSKGKGNRMMQKEVAGNDGQLCM